MSRIDEIRERLKYNAYVAHQSDIEWLLNKLEMATEESNAYQYLKSVICGLVRLFETIRLKEMVVQNFKKKELIVNF